MTEPMTPERRAMYQRALDGGYAAPVEVELWAEIHRLEARLARVTDESMVRRITYAGEDAWGQGASGDDMSRAILAAIRAVAADEQEATDA